MSDEQKSQASDGGSGATREDDGQLPQVAVGDIVCQVYRLDAAIERDDGLAEFKATHLETGSRHVLTPIPPEMAVDQAAMDQLTQEVGLLRYLEHPAVVDYEGVIPDDDGRDYMVRDFVEGPSLSAVMARGAFSMDDVRLLRDRIGHGLMAAHEHGITHGSFSPEKIILEEGDPAKSKIVDFGLVRPAEITVKTLETDASAGRQAYAAPEQLGLYGGHVDARTDIFAFGLVLAAAALGRGLDQDKTMVSLLKERQSKPDLSTLPEELRDDLAPLLEPDPDDRPASLGDIIVAEEAAQMAAKLTADPDYRSTSKQPSGRGGWTIAGVVVAVIALIGFASQQLIEVPSGDRVEAPTRPDIAELVESDEGELGESPSALDDESTPEPAETQVAESAEAPAEPAESATQSEPETSDATEPDSSSPPPEPTDEPTEAAVAEPSTPEPEPTGDQEGLLPPPELPSDLQETEEAASETQTAGMTEAEPAEASESEADTAGATEEATQEAGDPAQETAATETEPADTEPVESMTEAAQEAFEAAQQATVPEEAESETEEAADAGVDMAEPADVESEPAETEMAEAPAVEAETDGEMAAPDEDGEPVQQAEAPSESERFDSALSGTQRRAVQRGLQALGHYDGAIDGLFGPGTRAGVMAYQRSAGAAADGFVAADQLARLTEVADRVAAQQGQASSPSPSATAPAVAAPTSRQPTLAEALKAQESKTTGIGLGNDFEWLKRRALGGDRASQTRLAMRYQRGQGAPENLTEAVKWFRLAAEGGDPKGQYNLGLLYESGNGVAQDYAEAANWFAKAAAQNEPGARRRLDSLYERGLVEPPS